MFIQKQLPENYVYRMLKVDNLPSKSSQFYVPSMSSLLINEYLLYLINFLKAGSNFVFVFF